MHGLGRSSRHPHLRRVTASPMNQSALPVPLADAKPSGAAGPSLSRDEALKIINATAVCPIATEALASATRASAPGLELEVSPTRRTR